MSAAPFIYDLVEAWSVEAADVFGAVGEVGRMGVADAAQASGTGANTVPVNDIATRFARRYGASAQGLLADAAGLAAAFGASAEGFVLLMARYYGAGSPSTGDRLVFLGRPGDTSDTVEARGTGNSTTIRVFAPDAEGNGYKDMASADFFTGDWVAYGIGWRRNRSYATIEHPDNGFTIDSDQWTAEAGAKGVDEVRIGGHATPAAGFDMDVAQAFLFRGFPPDANFQIQWLHNGGALRTWAEIQPRLRTRAASRPALLEFVGDPSVPQTFTHPGGRIHPGVVFHRSTHTDKAVTITLYDADDEVLAAETTTVTVANLDNLVSDFTEDGIDLGEWPAGTYKVGADESGGSGWVGAGLIVRTGGTDGAIVENMGSAMHCSPVAWQTDAGELIEIKPRMHDGRRFLFVNGEQLGEVFSTVGSGDREDNDVYHYGHAVLAHDGGYAAFMTDHNEALHMVWAETVPGLLAATPVKVNADSTGDSYAQVVSLGNRMWLLSRTGWSGVIGSSLITIEDAATGTPAITYDRLVADRCYPKSIELLEDDAGNPLLVCCWNTREASQQDWYETVVLVYSPDDDRWYAPDGTAIGDATPGTVATPRFTTGEFSTAYSAGGGKILANNGTAQRYAPNGAVSWVQEWNPTTKAIGTLVPFCDSAAAAANQYAASDLRLCLTIGDQQTLTTANADPFLNGAGCQSYRMDCLPMWVGGTGARFVVTRRGGRRTGMGRLDTDEYALYYDMGGTHLTAFTLDRSGWTDSAMPDAAALLAAVVFEEDIDTSDRGDVNGTPCTVSHVAAVGNRAGAYLWQSRQGGLVETHQHIVRKFSAGVTTTTPPSGRRRARRGVRGRDVRRMAR